MKQHTDFTGSVNEQTACEPRQSSQSTLAIRSERKGEWKFFPVPKKMKFPTSQVGSCTHMGIWVLSTVNWIWLP